MQRKFDRMLEDQIQRLHPGSPPLEMMRVDPLELSLVEELEGQLI